MGPAVVHGPRRASSVGRASDDKDRNNIDNDIKTGANGTHDNKAARRSASWDGSTSGEAPLHRQALEPLVAHSTGGRGGQQAGLSLADESRGRRPRDMVGLLAGGGPNIDRRPLSPSSPAAGSERPARAGWPHHPPFLSEQQHHRDGRPTSRGTGPGAPRGSFGGRASFRGGVLRGRSGGEAVLRGGEAEVAGQAPRLCSNQRRVWGGWPTPGGVESFHVEGGGVEAGEGPRRRQAEGKGETGVDGGSHEGGEGEGSKRASGKILNEQAAERKRERRRGGRGMANWGEHSSRRQQLQGGDGEGGEWVPSTAAAAGGGVTARAAWREYGRHDKRRESGCGESWQAAGQGEVDAGRSGSGSLAANSGSASISGAGSGSLSLEEGKPSWEDDGEGGERGRGGGMGGQDGLGDNMSASRPASCGESFVEVREGSTCSRRSQPAASATAPAGAGSPSELEEPIQRGKHKRKRGGRVEAQPQQRLKRSDAESGAGSPLAATAPVGTAGPSGGEGESCAGDFEEVPCSGVRFGVATAEERKALLSRLRKLSGRTLRSLLLTLLFHHPALLLAAGDRLQEVRLPLDTVRQPVDTFRATFAAPQAILPPLTIPEAHLHLYTTSTLPSPWPHPVSLVLRTPSYLAAQMTEPGPDSSHAVLTLINVPEGESAPTVVACSCHGKTSAGCRVLWCKHGAGLALAATSTSVPSLDYARAEALLEGQCDEALADLLYSLVVLQNCTRWLSQHLELHCSVGSDPPQRGAPQDTSSAVEDTPNFGPVQQHSRSHVVTSEEDLHTIEQVIAKLDKLEPLPAAESKLIIEACESGRTNSLPPSEEILQKVWDLIAAGDSGYAWELLREVTAAATHSSCWRKLRQSMPGFVAGPPMRQTPQAMGFPGQEHEPLLAALIVVWESVTNPAQRAMFFAPLWDGGVPTARTAANAVAAPGWKRGVFSPYPHVCAVSLVGAVVGLVPGVLAGMAAAEALQARCSHELMACHLGILMSLGASRDQKLPQELMEPSLRVQEVNLLMEDLHGLANMLSAHAVWEQQLGVWDDPCRPPTPNANASYSLSKFGTGEDNEVNSLAQAAAAAAAAAAHRTNLRAAMVGRDPSWPSNASTATALPPLSSSGGQPQAGQLSLPTGTQQGRVEAPDVVAVPIVQPRLAEQQLAHQHEEEDVGDGGDGGGGLGSGHVPSLLWIAATAVAQEMVMHRPSDRLKILAMLVPPPSQHNTGWRGQAALITCLAASTGANANMFLMGMMASHHLRNLFSGAECATLTLLKLRCATLLALAPDEASAISGCYFLELCLTIVSSPTAVPNLLPPRPPDPLLGKDAVVQHVLDTLLTVMEREGGAPGGRPTIMMAALQSLWRILRRSALMNMGKVIAMQQIRWVRALARAAHMQSDGARTSGAVVVKALEVLWALMGRCQGAFQHPLRQATLREVGPTVVAAASKLLGIVLRILEAPTAYPACASDWVWAGCKDWAHSGDPLLQAEDIVEFAREAAARVVAALSYAPQIDVTTGRPVFDRALTASLLGALLAEPSAGLRARAGAAELLAAMVEREYPALCSTLASAPSTVSTLLNVLDADRPPALSDATAGCDRMATTALRTLVALFNGGRASEGDGVSTVGSGALPGQQLWRKVARQRVIRRLVMVARRCLSRCGEEGTSQQQQQQQQQQSAVGGECEGEVRALVASPVSSPFEPLYWALRLLEVLARHRPALLLEVDTQLLEEMRTGCAASLRRFAPEASSVAARLCQVHARAMRPT